MKNILLVVVVMFAGLLAGCSSGNSTPPPPAPTLTSIAVTPGTASVAAGLTQPFKATGTYSDNSTQDLTATATWTSSNTAVATISGGLAKGVVANATAITLTAAMSGISGTAQLTVTAAVLQSIAVTPANATVPLGTLTQLTATGTYSDSSTQDLTTTAAWTSSDTTIATIASSGLATALSISNTPITVTATSGGISGNTGLTVAAATLTSIVIPGGPTVTIANGTSYGFSALGLYNDGSKRNITTQVTWASSETGVATIVPAGRAQSLTVGNTTISATLGSVSQSVTLDVSSATIQSPILVAPSSTTIAPPTTQQFTATGTFSDQTTQNITHDVVWSSNAPGTATIGNTPGSIGLATAVASGTATISGTFTFGGATATGSVPLNVSGAALQSIAVTPASASLAPSPTCGTPPCQSSILQMQAIGTFSDGSTQHIESLCTWTSSDTTVATVNTFGTVTGVANGGPVTITCALDGATPGTASLTVEPLTAIAISTGNPGGLNVAAGTAISLVATGTLADGETQNLTSAVQWTSSDPTVATVSNVPGSVGQAAGNAPGTSTVTAAFSGMVGVNTLTVTDVTLTSITIKPGTADIPLGGKQQFTATGTFSDGSTESLTSQVTWSSSDTTVAIINSTGGISTTGTGTTNIGAQLGTVVATPAVLKVH